MKILGIETSCDETAAAIVDDNNEIDKRILSNVVVSQVKDHAPYGGVVPEIASRSHIAHIEKIVEKAMSDAGVSFEELDGIAVTSGPGLIGGVIVGLMVAKGIAAAAKKPLIGVNHLEGHALTVRLTGDVEFPFLLLLVSGGHCQIHSVSGIGKYKQYGTTLDDALGEAFDKVAKMLGLGYPGGPIVEKRALTGDPSRFNFPRPLMKKEGCDFSFSGLKTAVFRTINEFEEEIFNSENNEQIINDICASFQEAVGDILVDRVENAISLFKKEEKEANSFVIAGGVAANKYIFNRLKAFLDTKNFNIYVPPMNLCTDNAAMIAWAGLERLKQDLVSSLDIAPQARWPLENL